MRNPPTKEKLKYKNTKTRKNNVKTNKLSRLDQPNGITHYQPIKLLHIKGDPLKNLGTKNPKRSKEMNRIPKIL